MHRIRLLCFLMACCLHYQSIARTGFPEYRIKRLTPDQGLSQGSNYFWYEDSQGFMWITANDAVNRYDGSHVKVYNLKRYFRNCPPLQQGYGFAEDADGNIYIGSVHGLYIYHRNTDKFTLHEIFSAGGSKLAMPFAFHDGRIWCFNQQYEVASYRVVDGMVNQEFNIPLPPIRSVHVYYNANTFHYNSWPFCDRDGNMWFIGRNDIYTINEKTRTAQEIDIGKKHSIESAYYKRSDNKLFLGTANGLLVYDIATGQTTYTNSFGNRSLGYIRSVCCNDRIIVVNTIKHGLLLWDQRSGQCHSDLTQPRKLNNIHTLGVDKANRIWMCDDGLGQMIYDFNPMLLAKLPSERDAFPHMKEKGITQLAEMANGDMLVHPGVLLDHHTQRLKTFPMPMKISGDNLYATETDHFRSGAWILLQGVAVQQLYFAGPDLKLRKVFAKKNDSIGACQHIKATGSGSLLLSFSGGLFWLKGGKLQRVAGQPAADPFVISSLSKNRYAISYLNNDMWLSRMAGPDSLQFLKRILPGVQSFYIAEDTGRRQYWTGTNKGIYLLDSNFNTLKLFDANNGLAGTYIYGLLLDDEGSLWCSHQRGLSSIDTRDYTIVNYDKKDGIQDWDFNNRSFYKATDGTLYFGGVSGFNYFKPPLKPLVFYKPEVYIDEILVNNKVWLPDTNANQLRSLNLNYRQNNIAVNAVLKDLYGPSGQLVYRIRETDTAWTQLPGRSIISFNNLAPGTYTLELGSLDKCRNEVSLQKTIQITIAAPYYLKPWFWVLITVFCSALCFYAYMKIRLNRQRVAYRQQQALEQQRNKITADLHDDIGSSLSSLQINSNIVSLILEEQPERARKLLNKIAAQCKDLSGKIGDMIWSMKPGKEEFMSLSSRIRNFANDVMGETNMHYQVHIDNEAETRILNFTIRRNLVLIIKEAINNAVKYSAASKMEIRMEVTPYELKLIITDNGVGFEPLASTTGNGLANMKQRAIELSGSLAIQSAPGKGTSIIINIPMPAN